LWRAELENELKLNDGFVAVQNGFGAARDANIGAVLQLARIRGNVELIWKGWQVNKFIDMLA
jgi:hypothetical protein